MEEKERYVIRYDLDYNRCLIDTEENKGVGDYIQIVKLLNQCDKRIKELEQGLKTREGHINILYERNKVLLRLISKLYKELFPDGREVTNETCVDVAISQIKENQQLKQQLHDLTKKIVTDFYDEIRHRAILEDDYCPNHNFERKYGVRKCLLENIKDTILKKYGGGNESKGDVGE